MIRFIGLFITAIFLTACSHTYYVVRHAEKAVQGQNMSSDVPLSEAGLQRAALLMEIMKTKKIAFVFSTNTIRTISTAKPCADYFHLEIQVYGPKPDSAFMDQLKAIKQNTLIVGHSNTVDDIVNGLTGSNSVSGDLPDSEYDNLFVIKRNGKKVKFERKKFGN